MTALNKAAFVASPILASAVTGGLSWFLGGAITGVAPLYAASAAAGALLGVLAVLGPSRAVSRELASLQEKAARAERAEERDRVRPAPAVQDVRELCEFVTGLTKVLKTAEEVEAMRSAELERAVREAASGLAEAERLIEAARQRVADAGRVLAEAEGGSPGGTAAGGRS
jgi:hypothetical protein